MTKEISNNVAVQQSTFLVDEKQTKYPVCRLFCHPTAHPWTDMDEFCDLVPGKNCEPVPIEIQQKLGLQSLDEELKGHLVACDGALEHLGETRGTRKILMKLAFEDVGEGAVLQEDGTEVAATVHATHIQGAWDLSNAENPAHWGFNKFCKTHCDPLPHWPGHVDPLKAEEEEELYTASHSVHVRDLNKVMMKREELCDHEFTRRWKSSFAENAVLWSSSLLIR